MNLAMLRVGEKGKITRIGSVGPLKRRLMDMGVLWGKRSGWRPQWPPFFGEKCKQEI